jgi:hypothetical protein
MLKLRQITLLSTLHLLDSRLRFALLPTFIFAFQSGLWAQPNFTKTFGPAGITGISVVQNPDKGFTFCGNISPTNNFFTSVKVLVIRTDSLGNELWRKSFGRNDLNYNYKIVRTRDGGYAIGGYSQPQNSNYQQDMLLLRLKANGDSLWGKSYGQPSTSSEIAFDLIETSDKGFLLAGESAPSVLEYMHLVKTDSLGNTQWIKSPMSNYLDHRALTVKENPFGGFIVGGNTGSPIKALSVVRLDDEGNTLWAKRYSRGQFTPRPEDVVSLPDSGFLMVATVPLNANSTLANSWLLRLKSNGDTIKTKTFKNVRIRSIVQDNNGGFWLAGVRPGFDPISYLYKVNAQGDSLWGKEYSFYPIIRVEEANPTQDGGLIMVGSALENNEGKAILIKTDSLGNVPVPVSVSLPVPGLGELSLYPNPAGEELVLNSEIEAEMELSVFNVLGKSMIRIPSATGLRQRIPVATLPAGMYRLQVKTEKGTTLIPFQKL